MRCQHKSKPAILIGLLILFLALIYALNNFGCVFQDWELENPETSKRPRVVKENPKPIYNYKNMSFGDFMIYAGKEMKHMEEKMGYRIYKIFPSIRYDITMKPKIYILWVYYD